MKNQTQIPISKPKIIIIDDDPEWQKQVALPLKGKGYSVQFADTHNEALRMFNSQVFDLAIMNVHLWRELRSDWKMFWTNLIGEAQKGKMNVIVITAYIQGKDELWKEAFAYRDTIEDICFKQELTRASLERKVREVLERRQGALSANLAEESPMEQADNHILIDPSDPPIAIIRELLAAGFTPETLREFCQNDPLFRPIVSNFGPKYTLNDMVGEVITFCHIELLWHELLARIKEANPRQYARFAPHLTAYRKYSSSDPMSLS